MQEWADNLRERFAVRHQRIAKHHIARRDYWRWQDGRHWSDLIPAWFPWAAAVVFWLLVLVWVLS